MHPLYIILKKVKSEEEFLELLNITLTEKEQEMILERWQILAALEEGLSQREVAKKVNCSVVTVTRGAKAYREQKENIKKWLSFLKKAEQKAEKS